jgi:hypothetical protein
MNGDDGLEPHLGTGAEQNPLVPHVRHLLEEFHGAPFSKAAEVYPKAGEGAKLAPTKRAERCPTEGGGGPESYSKTPKCLTDSADCENL